MDDDDARFELELIEAYGGDRYAREADKCQCSTGYVCQSCWENY